VSIGVECHLILGFEAIGYCRCAAPGGVRYRRGMGTSRNEPTRLESALAATALLPLLAAILLQSLLAPESHRFGGCEIAALPASMIAALVVLAHHFVRPR